MRLMRKGDMVVQSGTMHAWRNTSKTEWARFLVVVQPIEQLQMFRPTAQPTSLINKSTCCPMGWPIANQYLLVYRPGLYPTPISQLVVLLFDKNTTFLSQLRPFNLDYGPCSPSAVNHFAQNATTTYYIEMFLSLDSIWRRRGDAEGWRRRGIARS